MDFTLCRAKGFVQNKLRDLSRFAVRLDTAKKPVASFRQERRIYPAAC
jgi:hypothetical protein